MCRQSEYARSCYALICAEQIRGLRPDRLKKQNEIASENVNLGQNLVNMVQEYILHSWSRYLGLLLKEGVQTLFLLLQVV